MNFSMSFATALASTLPPSEETTRALEGMAALSLVAEQEKEEEEEEVEVGVIDRRRSMATTSFGGGDRKLLLFSVAVVVPLAKPAALAALAVTRCMQKGRGRESEGKERSKGRKELKRKSGAATFFRPLFLSFYKSVSSDLPEVDVDDVSCCSSSAAATAATPSSSSTASAATDDKHLAPLRPHPNHHLLLSLSVAAADRRRLQKAKSAPRARDGERDRRAPPRAPVDDDRRGALRDASSAEAPGVAPAQSAAKLFADRRVRVGGVERLVGQSAGPALLLGDGAHRPLHGFPQDSADEAAEEAAASAVASGGRASQRAAASAVGAPAHGPPERVAVALVAGARPLLLRC